MSAAATEADLLRDYAATGSQEVFAALVARHVDLVYSAALRQLRSRPLAEEVTQNAFLALARHARRLKPDTPLAAWLYVVTRRAAIDTLRSELRRQAREKTAMEISAMNSSSGDWPRIEPLLDTAMEALPERDRTALLLRYFEGKSLREVGAALGTSEDAAQKSVSRALDRLRAFFSQRGLATSATSLATSLSAHAVHSAPLGLGVSISASAAALAPAAALTAAKLLTMTTAQKTLFAVTAALGLGVGLYEYRIISRQHDQLAVAQRDFASLQTQLGRLRQERDTAHARWSALDNEIEAARAALARSGRTAPAQLAAEADMKAVLDRVAELKRRIAAVPGKRARAAERLKKEDWIKVVLENPLQTDADIEKALQEIQDQVKVTWANHVQQALNTFLKSSGGLLPTDPTQLAPFLPPDADASILPRFQMLRTGPAANVPSNAWLVADIGAVDDDAETLFMFGPGNMQWGSGGERGARRAVLRAYADYVRQHHRAPADAAQLQPLLRQPVDPAELKRFWEQHAHALR